jgi:hypothetical protein
MQPQQPIKQLQLDVYSRCNLRQVLVLVLARDLTCGCCRM